MKSDRLEFKIFIWLRNEKNEKEIKNLFGFVGETLVQYSWLYRDMIELGC